MGRESGCVGVEPDPGEAPGKWTEEGRGKGRGWSKKLTHACLAGQAMLRTLDFS